MEKDGKKEGTKEERKDKSFKKIRSGQILKIHSYKCKVYMPEDPDHYGIYFGIFCEDHIS